MQSMKPSSISNRNAHLNTITNLDLSNNRFTDDMADCIARLMVFPNLVEINLAGNQFSHVKANLTFHTEKQLSDDKLRVSIQTNSELQYLNYDRLSLSEELLIDLLNFNRTLCRLVFRDQTREWACNNYTIIEWRNRSHSRFYRKEAFLMYVRRKLNGKVIGMSDDNIRIILEMADLMVRWDSLSYGDSPPMKLQANSSFFMSKPEPESLWWSVSMEKSK
jgi:hypothetical protein